ncbi:ComEA family DNA-binding protein [uncultured Ruminococcus sp.]|uniref:ComEA family DNA-binding protein n=1 Tax=uncultured Ruminococcus sp. TaxID=165186 RepID=UPI0025CFC249|nr:helix-hairpin-helix domain-containing protein [uncultured Ruminococcus sp.]
MNDGLRKKVKEYWLYAVLAAALLISAVISAQLRKSDNKTVVVYKASSEEDTSAEEISKRDSRASSYTKKKKAETTTTSKNKVTTAKKPAETTKKTTKATTSKPVKTTRSSEETITICFPIDINQVTFDELTAIDGVGESTAGAILGLRDELGRITYMEQLLEISGIGENRLEHLREYLYVAEGDYSPPAEETHAEETPAATAVTDAPQVEIPAETTVTEITSPETISTAEITVSSPETERQQVDINTADKQELMEKLLIDEELAEMILDVREQLGGRYESYLQLLYVSGISKEFLSELKEYIICSASG